MCCLASKHIKKWSEMPSELLECISDRLPLLDYLRFRCVCKGWLLSPSGRRDITRFSKNSPWMMLYGFDDINGGKCYIYSKSHLKWCTFLLPHLRGATCEESMSGWLLARRHEHLFFSNPFTLEKIDLPKYPKKITDDHICTFAFLPNSPDCTAFVITHRDSSTLEVCSCRVSDTRWETDILNLSEHHLGTLGDAYSHTCDETCPDHCKLKETIYISINSTNRRLSYDFVEKKLELEQIVDADSEDLYESIEALHGTNWLGEFGKFISLSFCGLNMRSEGSCGYKRHACEVSTEGKEMKPAKRVRAAWIEPQFGRTI